MNSDPLVSVVVPVYNEVDTLEKILKRIREVEVRKEIILVDDGSRDGTRDLLGKMELPDLKIVLHERNQGKGAALRTGFQHVSGDIILVQDADLEYDPSQYPALIAPIVEDQADVVYGSRFLKNGSNRVLSFWHSMGNRTLTLASNMATDLNLTDMETCYKVFRREVIDTIAPTLREKRFGIEPEITAKIARKKYRVYEIGISYHGRSYSEGKKIGVKDAVRALWCILKYRFS